MHDPNPESKPASSSELPADSLQVMRIIFGALLMGCLSFLGVSLFLRLQKGQLFGPDPWALDSPLPIVALAAGIPIILGHWLLPGLVSSPPPPDEKAADPYVGYRKYQTWFIVGQAMLEGAAFLGLTVYFTEGSGIGLGLAIVCIWLMALRFPTQGAYEAFLGG